MQAQEVWETIEPKNPQNPVVVKRDKMEMAAIYQAIPEEALLTIEEKQTAKEAWEILKTMYLGADRVKTAKVQTLKDEFEMMNMSESQTMDDFSAKLGGVVSNIRALGETVQESYIVKKNVTSTFQICSTCINN